MESRETPPATPCNKHGWHQSVAAGRCQLCTAIADGDLDGVKEWLTPENMESRGRRGWTPLVYACRHGQVEIIRYLVDAGACLTTIDNRGQGLLHHAQDARVVEILLDFELDVNHKDRFKDTPLHAAGRKPVNVVRLLLEAGADVFALDSIGRSPLAKFHYGIPQTMLLLEYFGTASEMCQRAGCRCKSLIFMCSYYKAHRIPRVNLSHGVGMYDEYIIKRRCAGLPLDDNIRFIPNPDVDELFTTDKEAFTEECYKELERMGREKVWNTVVTYRNVFKQNMSALRNHVVQQILTADHCNQEFRIYGETLRLRLVAGVKRLALIDTAVTSFAPHLPLLLPECVSSILNYLDTQQLQNVIISCTGRGHLISRL